MGCNCKNVKKLDKMLNINEVKYEKKGAWEAISDISINLLNKVFVVTLMVILIPIVMIYFIFSFVFGNKMVVKLTKIFSKMKSKMENE